MRATRISINNFRGIKQALLLLPKHGVLVGDNNTDKTTILEALDLVLGPDRLNRQPPIDEHDFFRGVYTAKTSSAAGGKEAEAQGGDGAAKAEAENTDAAAEASKIAIEVTVADLTEEQQAKFGDYVEFWDSATDKFYDEPAPDGVDAATITEALRLTFLGWYDTEEDDFEGKTYFTRSLAESERPELFSKKHKQVCGFLYLRSLRTGSRALSLERGSLLDIILRVKDVRPLMWEDTLGSLSDLTVASDPELGLSPILEGINTALKKYVPKEWGVEPRLKVSNLTREHLRKVITAFIATGDGDHAAPFYRQGTGHLRDGGARNSDPSVCTEADRARGAQARFTDTLHLTLSLRCRGVLHRRNGRAWSGRRRRSRAAGHRASGQREAEALSAAIPHTLLRRSARAPRPGCRRGDRGGRLPSGMPSPRRVKARHLFFTSTAAR
jgi:putative ATP-dependent endonuclease of the OLD family